MKRSNVLALRLFELQERLRDAIDEETEAEAKRNRAKIAAFEARRRGFGSTARA